MTDIEEAKKIMTGSGYTCVLYRNGEVRTSCSRGVKPLLEFIDTGDDFTGFSAADRVVGRAAAFLYIRLGISCIYAGIISEQARDVFDRNDIEYSFGESVPLIFNRTNTGLCPMESSVIGIDSTALAERAIRNKLAEITDK